MTKHRSHSAAFKRQVAEEFIAGETLAAILDAWSRKVVGYAISRSMNARIAVAALKAAIRNRQPSKSCMHHSDRGSQGGLNWSSQHWQVGQLRWRDGGARIGLYEAS